MKYEPWIMPYFRMFRWRFLLVVLLGTLASAAAGALMFTSGYLISKAALQPYNILMIYVPIVGVRTFGIGRAALHYIERLHSHDTILRVLSDMRVKLYRKLEPQALRIHSLYRTGDLLGILSDDIEHLQNLYIRTVFPSVTALILYGAAVTAVGSFDPAFALLLAAYLALLVFVFPFVSLWLTKKANREAKQRRNRLYRTLTDAVLGLRDWIISGRQRQFMEAYEDNEREHARIERKLRHWTLLRSLASQLVVGVIVLSMLYWSGARYAEGQLDNTLIAAFVLVALAMAEVFLPVSDAVQKLPSYGDSLDRLRSVEQPVEPTTPAGPNDGSATQPADSLHGAPLEPIRDAHIRLHRVSFRYGEQEAWQLNDVTLDIPQGRKIAVIGRSGAGKSTLLKLIQGVIRPSAGSITLNGASLEQIPDLIPRVVGVLNQRPHLFDATVSSNIRLGKPGASDEEVRSAAGQVRLDKLIESLPQGYHTSMMEAGQRFSGGEGQRIALARILLQDTPVVILDEPTVGLDPFTENALLSTILETLRNKTLIWVTHHLTGVERMDEVIFMEQGRIVMRGTHQELMASHERYRRLYRLDQPGTI